MPVIFTCIFGAYDDLKEPMVLTSGWKYICFTNQELYSKTWQIINVPVVEGNERLTSKRYKILPHLFIDDRQTIYIDGSFIINCNLNNWFKRHQRGISFIKHPFRQCVYKEGAACHDKADLQKLHTQLTRFKEIGIPQNNGMVASGIILRDGSHIDFCQEWYEEYVRGCERDQIAWAYADFKMPHVSQIINWDYRTGPEFLFIPHNKTPEKKAARIQYLKQISHLKSYDPSY